MRLRTVGAKPMVVTCKIRQNNKEQNESSKKYVKASAMVLLFMIQVVGGYVNFPLDIGDMRRFLLRFGRDSRQSDIYVGWVTSEVRSRFLA